MVLGKLGGAAFQGRVGKRRGVKLALFGRLRMKTQLVLQYHEVPRFDAGTATESHSLPPLRYVVVIILYFVPKTQNMHFMFLSLCFIIENMEELLTITAIEPQKRNKDRYNIYADGEYAASLGAEAIVKAGIKTGAPISKKALDDAVLADNVQFAFDSAVKLLAHGMRTRGDLEQRLRGRGIAEEAIVPALDKLESYGYVDDMAYAREFVNSDIASGRWGRAAVAHRLREKRLPREIIEQAMLAYTEEEERENARRQLESIKSKSAGDKRQMRQKAYAALARRGFSSDIINDLFSEADD